MNTSPRSGLKQTEKWQFWQEWENTWLSIKWNFCLSPELYKMYNNTSQTILGELFTRNNHGYYLRSKSDFVIMQIRAVLKGSNSIRCFGPIIGNT